MRTTLEYVHCDLCKYCADVSSDVRDSWADVLSRSKALGFRRRRIRGHVVDICPSCWQYRKAEVDALYS